MRNDYKIILDIIPNGSKVLDIGCSSGELLTLLNKKDHVHTPVSYTHLRAHET